MTSTVDGAVLVGDARVVVKRWPLDDELECGHQVARGSEHTSNVRLCIQCALINLRAVAS